MRSIGRMVAMGAATAALAVGGAAAAQAQTAATIHTYTCATQDECNREQLVFKHYGYAVSDVWYHDPDSTCAPEWPCAPGWQFQWSE